MHDERLRDVMRRLAGARDRLSGLREKTSQLRTRLEGDVPLGVSLDRLAEQARRATLEPRDEPSREDGLYLGDAWEIALVNEEGK